MSAPARASSVITAARDGGGTAWHAKQKKQKKQKRSQPLGARRCSPPPRDTT